MTITLAQPGPYSPSEDETSGSIRGAIRAAMETVYKSVAVILFGLIAVAPWVLALLGLYYGFRRLSRGSAAPAATSKPPEKPEAAGKS